MKKLVLAAFAVISGSTMLTAQNYGWCATDKHFLEAVAQNPLIQIEADSLDAWILANQDLIMSSSEGGGYIIPVVVHIIHNYGMENISDAQIVDAINILNEDFNAANTDLSDVVAGFQAVIGNAQFQFRLAQKDPNGNCTNGITRTVNYWTDKGNEYAKSINWPRNKYYNMWVVKDIDEGEGAVGVTAGYATLPSSWQNPSTDGILMAHNYFGSIGTSSGSNFAKRVLTHETGHFFNLRHTFGNVNVDQGNCSGTDNVSDTPPTPGNFSTCPLSRSACGPLENVQNFMDYSNCTKMFTAGQATRMTTAINSGTGQRNGLWQGSNLIATGTNDGYVSVACGPIADFSATYFSVCTGTSVTFKDASWNDTPTSWNWTVTNGTVTLNSGDQDPTFMFDTPGTYDVTLTVSSAGGNDTKTKTNMLHVLDNNATASMVDFAFADAFDNQPLSSQRWLLGYASNSFGWEETGQASSSAPNSLMVDNFGAPIGQVFNLISPSYDFSTVPWPITVTFKYAYARRNNNSIDMLKVYATSNCGQTWSLRGTYDVNSLMTASNTTLDWFPSASQWQTKSITNLNSFWNKESVRLRFEFISGGGNNFFLDDLNIAGPLGIDDLSKEHIGLTLYPNPASDQTNVRFLLDKTYPVQIRISDVAGRIIYTSVKKDYPAGENNIVLSLDQIQNSGLYFMEVNIGTKRYVERLIVE